MRHWRSGDFDRLKAPSAVHPFLPAHAAESLESINLDHLWARGKRLILLDVDNTIVRWRSEEFQAPVLDWVERAKAIGFDICIISNTRHPERLERIVKRLDVATVRGRFKPSRAMFRLACLKFKRQTAEAIMIGDQLMTDILGANRAGIDAIWVRRMDGKEFSGTKVNRLVERMLTGAIYRALVLPEKPAPETAENPRPAPTISDTTIVKQLTRFAVVGGSAFVIDFATKKVVGYAIHVGSQPLVFFVGDQVRAVFPWLQGHTTPESAGILFVGVPISVCVMFYTYFFNRRWTFEAVGKADKHVQIRRFFTISLFGLALQNTLLSVFLRVLPGQFAICTVVSTFFSTVWNFVGQRFYAFQDRRK